MLPASGLLQIGVQAMADRFMYLPMIGLLIAFAWSATEVVRLWNPPRRVTRVGAGLALAACAAISSIQLGYWKNSIALWEHTIAVTPANALAQNNLAYAFYEARHYDEAFKHAAEAARIRPDFGEPRLQMGMVFEAKGQVQEALAPYKEAVAIHPNWPLARKRLGDALAKIGKSSEAVEQYEAFLQMLPGVIEVHLRLAELLSREGKAAEAIAQGDEVFE